MDRGHDALDIFTATAGVGFGAKARVGPCLVGAGILFDACGLQNGEAFFGEDWDHQCINGCDFMLLLLSGESYRESPYTRQRGYGSDNVHYLFSIYYPEKNSRMPVKQFTQIEVAGALLGSVRLGFNPGELLDFLLGWFGIDIYGDDIAMKKLREERAKKPTAQPSQDKRNGTDKPAPPPEKAKT